MNGGQEVTYAFDLRPAKSSDRQPSMVGDSIPRIARLMALAIRFEGLLREKKIRDYAELARRGRVTRARMTQIMKLVDLAPDIQEQILFVPSTTCLNERNLRSIVRKIDWEEQRSMFRKIIGPPGVRTRHLADQSALARFEFGSLRPKTLNRLVRDYRVKSSI